MFYAIFRESVVVGNNNMKLNSECEFRKLADGRRSDDDWCSELSQYATISCSVYVIS